jgi:hypothetical protein
MSVRGASRFSPLRPCSTGHLASQAVTKHPIAEGDVALNFAPSKRFALLDPCASFWGASTQKQRRANARDSGIAEDCGVAGVSKVQALARTRGSSRLEVDSVPVIDR